MPARLNTHEHVSSGDTYDTYPDLTESVHARLIWDEELEKETIKIQTDGSDSTIHTESTYVVPPAVTTSSTDSLVVWAEGNSGESWTVRALTLGDDSQHVVESGARYASVSAASDEKGPLVAFEEITEDGIRVGVTGFNGGEWERQFTSGTRCSQPQVAAAEGRRGVVFAQYSGQGYDIVFRDLESGDQQLVCRDGIYNQMPDLTFDGAGRTWVTWVRESERINPNREHYLRDHVRVQTPERFALQTPWYKHMRAYVRRLDRELYTRLGSHEHRNAHYPRLVTDEGNRPYVVHRSLVANNRDLDTPLYGVLVHRGPEPGESGGHLNWDGPYSVDGGYPGRNSPVGVAGGSEITLTWGYDTRPSVSQDDAGGYSNDTKFVRVDDAIREGDGRAVRVQISSDSLDSLERQPVEQACSITPTHTERREFPSVAETSTTTDIHGVEHELVYGNLHRHSTISMCGSDFDMEQQFHYRYAMDVTGEAFTAVTDHAEDMTSFDWHESNKLAETYHAAGSFVVFPAYEFTGSRHVYTDYRETDSGFGHAHVINRRPGLDRHHIYDDETPTVQALLDAVDPSETIPIPHHPADGQFPYDWDGLDDSIAPVVELFQDYRGASEFKHDPRHVELPQTPDERHYVQTVLGEGRKLGFMSSGDHYSIAFAGVYTEDRTRDALFEAIRDRRCFATTGGKLQLHLQTDEAFMGDQIAAAGEEVTFSGSVVGTDTIDAVEFIANGEINREWSPNSNQFDFAVTAADVDPGYYYVRVHQVDEQMGWTTPIYIE